MARILLIDDDVMLVRLLEEYLTQEGFEVTSAGYAGEGLKMALENPPDLIMLDLLLPDATGYQTCWKLRHSPQTYSIPILMMTSAARLPSQHVIGRLMGANDCMVKPLNLIDAGNRVHSLLVDAGTARKASIAQTAPPGFSFVSTSAALFDRSSA